VHPSPRELAVLAEVVEETEAGLARAVAVVELPVAVDSHVVEAAASVDEVAQGVVASAVAVAVAVVSREEVEEDVDAVGVTKPQSRSRLLCFDDKSFSYFLTVVPVGSVMLPIP
jgi:hypothetical protein